MKRTFQGSFTKAAMAASAVQKLKAAGINKIRAYGPYPDEELLSMTVPSKPSTIPLFALVGGVTGSATGFYLQYWTAAIQYPLNIGGRPLNSWPAFIPITFELTVLFAAGSIILGFLWRTGLPRLHHPAFEIENFERVSDNLFFVVVEVDDDALATQAVVLEFGLRETP